MDPSLEFLISNIPPETAKILEVGCGDGANLRVISSIFPQVYCEGFDPMVQKQQINSNVALVNGTAPERLKHYSDKAFDFVFTRSVLMYIPSWKIKETLVEILRVGKHGLLIEQGGSKVSFSDRITIMRHTCRNLGNYQKYRCFHNFEALFKSLGIDAKISPLPFTLGDKFWDKYGVVILT